MALKCGCQVDHVNQEGVGCRHTCSAGVATRAVPVSQHLQCRCRHTCSAALRTTAAKISCRDV
jgi:hypothetical protein